MLLFVYIVQNVTATVLSRRANCIPSEIFFLRRERRFRLTALSVDNFERLSESADKLINQLAVPTIGGMNKKHIARNDVTFRWLRGWLF